MITDISTSLNKHADRRAGTGRNASTAMIARSGHVDRMHPDDALLPADGARRAPRRPTSRRSGPTTPAHRPDDGRSGIPGRNPIRRSRRPDRADKTPAQRPRTESLALTDPSQTVVCDGPARWGGQFPGSGEAAGGGQTRVVGAERDRAHTQSAGCPQRQESLAGGGVDDLHASADEAAGLDPATGNRQPKRVGHPTRPPVPATRPANHTHRSGSGSTRSIRASRRAPATLIVVANRAHTRSRCAARTTSSRAARLNLAAAAADVDGALLW